MTKQPKPQINKPDYRPEDIDKNMVLTTTTDGKTTKLNPQPEVIPEDQDGPPVVKTTSGIRMTGGNR